MAWTPTTVRNQATYLLSVARHMRKKQAVAPVAFLLVDILDGTENAILLVEDLGTLSREGQQQVIRGIVSRTGARFVIFISEAWSLETKKTGEESAGALDTWLASGRSLAEHPDATEQLFCAVDGPGLATLFSSRIRPDGSTEAPREIAGPSYGRMTNLSGRLGEN